MYSNENFNPSIVSVLAAAEAEARSLGHNFIGSEMILLGLLILDFIPDLSLDAVRAEVENQIGRGSGTVDNATLPLTPDARAILDRAITLANEQDLIVQPQHLLFAICDRESFFTICYREPFRESLAIKILENLNFDIPELIGLLVAHFDCEMELRSIQLDIERGLIPPRERFVNPPSRSSAPIAPKKVHITTSQESGRFVAELSAIRPSLDGPEFRCNGYGDTEFDAIAEAFESLAQIFRQEKDRGQDA